MPLEGSVFGALMNLEPCRFNYRPETGLTTEDQIGLIAEQVDEHVSELVVKDPTGKIVGVNYLKMVPMLLAMIQTQQHDIEELKEKVNQ